MPRTLSAQYESFKGSRTMRPAISFFACEQSSERLGSSARTPDSGLCTGYRVVVIFLG